MVHHLFSDEEAVYLFVILLGGLLVMLFMGRMLAPAITALVLAYLMQGLINALMRRGMGHTGALYLVYIFFITLLFGTLMVLTPMVWKQTLTLVQDQLPRLLSSSESWLRHLPERYPDMVSAMQAEQLAGALRSEVAELGQSVLTVSLSSIPQLVQVMVFIVLVPLLVFSS